MEKGIFKGYAAKKLIFSLALLLVLVAVSESIAAEFRSFSENSHEMVEINTNRADSGYAPKLIRYGHISTLKGRFPEGSVSFSSRLDSIMKQGGFSVPVRVILTDESYPTVSGMKIIRGSYFNSSALTYGRNVAVISRELAERLFMSIDAIGNEVTLFDESYVIVGLYEPSKTLLSLLGSYGAEVVYVPFTSYLESGNLTVDTVSIHDRKLGEAVFKQYQVGDILRKELRVQAEAYRIIDYYGSDTIVSQWLGLFLFLVALAVFFMLLGIAGRVLGQMRDFFCAGLKRDYLPGFIRKQSVPVFIFTGKLLGLVGLSVLLIIYARPRIFIPTQYLPPDNIFDFGFYWEKIKEAIQMSNAMAGYIPTPLEHCFHASSSVGFILLLLMIPAFISLISAMKLLKSLVYPIKRFILLFLLSIILALAVLILLWASGLIYPAISVKGMAILELFCIVYFLRKYPAGGQIGSDSPSGNG